MEKSEITQHLVNLLNDRVTVTPNSYHFNHEPFDTTLMYIHLRENDSMNNQYFDNQYKFFISEIHNIRNFAKTPDTLEAAIKSNELQSIVLNRNRHNSILYNIKNKYNPQNIIIAIDEQLEEWQVIAEDANIGIKNISNAINKLKLNLLGFEDFDHFITDVTNPVSYTHLIYLCVDGHMNIDNNIKGMDDIRPTAIKFIRVKRIIIVNIIHVNINKVMYINPLFG